MTIPELIVHFLADTTAGHYTLAGAVVIACLRKGWKKL